MDSLSFSTILVAVACGVVPPLIWLYFLLHEAREHPEPRTLIFIAFLSGMLAVGVAIPLESIAAAHFPNGLELIISWAVIEETAKYGLTAIFVLCRKQVHEPMDIVIYMLTTALGFAALENTLFLIAPFAQDTVTTGLITDNLRFFGSTLLHVVASSAIGFALAFSYAKSRPIRTVAAAAGLILAVALHTVFNFFIINENGSETIIAFFIVWTGAIVFFALFEVLKYFRNRNLPITT